MIECSFNMSFYCLGWHDKGLHAALLCFALLYCNVNVTVLYSWCLPTRCGEPTQCFLNGPLGLCPVTEWTYNAYKQGQWAAFCGRLVPVKRP